VAEHEAGDGSSIVTQREGFSGAAVRLSHECREEPPGSHSVEALDRCLRVVRAGSQVPGGVLSVLIVG
jgi:hypothetical protein